MLHGLWDVGRCPWDECFIEAPKHVAVFEPPVPASLAGQPVMIVFAAFLSIIVSIFVRFVVRSAFTCATSPPPAAEQLQVEILLPRGLTVSTRRHGSS